MVVSTDNALHGLHNTGVNPFFVLILKDSAVLVFFVVVGLISNSLDTVVYHVTVRQMNLPNKTIFEALGHLDDICETARALLVEETHKFI